MAILVFLYMQAQGKRSLLTKQLVLQTFTAPRASTLAIIQCISYLEHLINW